MWIAGDRCTGLGRNPSHVLLWARRSPPGSRYVRAAIPLVRMKQCPERRCVNLASVKVAIRGITPGWPGRLRAPHLLRHWSFLRGINLLFPRKRRTGYIFSGTRLCNRRHRRCRRVFAPPFLHHQHGVIQTLQADCTHCCLGRHEHHRLQSWAGENESIRVCPPPLRPRRPPVDDLPRCVILNSSLPRWSPLSLFCFCVSDSMLSAASLLCSSWAAWRSLQAWLASSRFSGGRDGFLVAILSFAICMPSLVST